MTLQALNLEGHFFYPFTPQVYFVLMACQYVCLTLFFSGVFQKHLSGLFAF